LEWNASAGAPGAASARGLDANAVLLRTTGEADLWCVRVHRIDLGMIYRIGEESKIKEKKAHPERVRCKMTV
jgi:hypothetical protein